MSECTGDTICSEKWVVSRAAIHSHETKHRDLLQQLRDYSHTLDVTAMLAWLGARDEGTVNRASPGTSSDAYRVKQTPQNCRKESQRELCNLCCECPKKGCPF